jgi:hypothetical protein
MAIKKPVMRVLIESDIDTRQKLKVLASLEGQTMQEWLTWVVTKAYESKLTANKKRQQK